MLLTLQLSFLDSHFILYFKRRGLKYLCRLRRQVHPSSFWLLDSFEFEKLVKFRCGCWKALFISQYASGGGNYCVWWRWRWREWCWWKWIRTIMFPVSECKVKSYSEMRSSNTKEEWSLSGSQKPHDHIACWWWRWWWDDDVRREWGGTLRTE